MNHITAALPNGRFVLGKALIIRIEQGEMISKHNERVSLRLPITAVIKQNDGWEIRYSIEGKEQVATLTKAPIE